MANILVINGPNLNMLGKREPEHYGRQTLGDIIEELENLADDYEVRLYNFQSNAEHEIVERIQAALNESISSSSTPPLSHTPVWPFGMRSPR